MSDFFLSVVVPRPIPGFFTYRISSDWKARVKIGSRVRVQFGRAVTHAFVVELPRDMSELSTSVEVDTLKPVLEILEEQSVPSDLWALCRWAQEYYACSLGEVLHCAIPKIAEPKKARKRSRPKQYEKKTFKLTGEQSRAFDEIEQMRTRKQHSVVLLQGVTGSGKTEIYIQLTRRVLAEGKSVIILVPEIALTSQLHQRFESSLGIAVALWHSAVSNGQRSEQSSAMRKGELRVIVGARSAVFAPVIQLGLVIVDEEHDSSYKQEERFKYHARDLAIVRAKQAGGFALLGSATPSLESRERVREGRYGMATLKERIGRGGMPPVELVDLKVRSEWVQAQAPLSFRTLEAIQMAITAGEQVIVYLNRRGFAAFLLCKDCGEVKGCSQCSISLTVHRKSTQLRCHVCGHQEAIPDFCGKCQSSELLAMGSGTESLEGDLARLISGAKITRLDRDRVTSASRLEKTLAEFRKGDFNLLLGTQMLVKGHDFPGVTLVVVVLADGLFRWPDFRAGERAFQVLQQVAGRAGRGDKSGRVMIQAFDLDHPVLQVLDGKIAEDHFMAGERELRQALSYPPFGRLARLRLENASRQQAMERAQAVTQVLETMVNDSFEVLGPSTAFMERVRGVYRWDILLKVKNIQDLQRAIFAAGHFCAERKWQIIVDVDPYGL